MQYKNPELRLNCLRAFYSYAAMRDASLVVYQSTLFQIPFKKTGLADCPSGAESNRRVCNIERAKREWLNYYTLSIIPLFSILFQRLNTIISASVP